MKIFTKEWYRSGCINHQAIKDKNYIDNDLIGLHDCQIVSEDFITTKSPNEYAIQLDNSGSASRINKIIVENYTVIENCKINNAWCIAEELYKLSDGKYEFHLLIQTFPEEEDDESDELNYLTVNCEKIKFIGDGFYCLYDKKSSKDGKYRRNR
ncbi:MAG: DUF4085 family protein [Eubacterium sp.]|nr:DUF4085 family protein [Eubacterium sp.]